MLLQIIYTKLFQFRCKFTAAANKNIILLLHYNEMSELNIIAFVQQLGIPFVVIYGAAYS